MTASTKPITAAEPPKPRRQDLIALWAGIVFSFVFVAIIWLAGKRLDSIALLPDQGAAWYYWKLPAPTWITLGRPPGGCYLAQQLTILGPHLVCAEEQAAPHDRAAQGQPLGAGRERLLYPAALRADPHLVRRPGAGREHLQLAGGLVIVLAGLGPVDGEQPARDMFGGKKLPIKQELIRFAGLEIPRLLLRVG